MTTIEIHVTRVSGAAVYGHETSHCDAAGCNGVEHYYPQVPADDLAAGDVYEALCWEVGDRVEGGEGDDHDTGRVAVVRADGQVTVAWDSCIETTQPGSLLRAEVA